MKTDARVRYTHMVIKNSFVKILKDKPLSKVTVKEICELSEINRATFYKYYNDPYDLMNKLEQQFLDELVNNVQYSQKDFKDTFTLILVSIKANSELYLTLFSENGNPHFSDKIFSLCYQYLDTNIDKRFQKVSLTEQTWLYYFVAQGCGGILTQWLKGGMAEPISDVVDFTDKLLQNILNSL